MGRFSAWRSLASLRGLAGRVAAVGLALASSSSVDLAMAAPPGLRDTALRPSRDPARVEALDDRVDCRGGRAFAVGVLDASSILPPGLPRIGPVRQCCRPPPMCGDSLWAEGAKRVTTATTWASVSRKKAWFVSRAPLSTRFDRGPPLPGHRSPATDRVSR